MKLPARLFRSRVIVALGLATIGAVIGFAVHAQTPAARPAAPARAPEPPRLVVFLVVDQFRGDYVQWYGQQWTKGLRRLYDNGAVFPLAAYPYAGTVTCPGHFTIGTGSLPATHGMVGNNWYDPATNRLVLCSSDPTATSVPFGGGTGTEHHSPRSLLAPAFADELRLQEKRAPQILSVSLKPRSAIGLGGHGGPGTIVLWEEDSGVWATSDAFTKTPWPAVDEYVRAHPITASYGQTWTKLLPNSSYLFEDDAPGESQPAPWTRVFPHEFKTASGKPDNIYVSAWERSPLSDAYIADMVINLITTMKLGQKPGTDMLAVSFSALDLVGHEYGPRSHEVQDVMARLDIQIGRLLDTLDRLVGPTRYTLAFSADHGSAPLPEQAVALGMDAGRVSLTEIRDAVQKTAASVLGEGTYYGSFAEENVYLTAGTLQKLMTKPAAITGIKDALGRVKGIARVYGPDELSSNAPTDDGILRAARMSYRPGRSGDFIVIPKPYWVLRSTGTTHGTPYAYDQHVPVLFFGAGIKPGRYLVPASPVDIAPTLAAITGIALARTDGQVLNMAIR